MHAGDSVKMTYTEVLFEVCKLANWLRSAGVGPGDTVAVYMQMVSQLPITMLACARIGAVHTVVFAGFSSEALGGRIVDSGAKVRFFVSHNTVYDEQSLRYTWYL